MSIKDLATALKHLPGKHPQKTHAGSRGGGGGSASVEAKTKTPIPTPSQPYGSKGTKPDAKTVQMPEGKPAAKTVNMPGIKPESAYDKMIVRMGDAAIKAGIKTHSDSKAASRLGSAAAELINGRTKVGYTVYGTDIPAYSSDKAGNMVDKGYFAAVAYGSGTTKTQVSKMRGFLKAKGWKVMDHPEGGSIIISG